MTPRRYRVGIDVGGTFTDLVLYDRDTGRTRLAKVPSTPGDQSIAILDGLEKLGVQLGEIDAITHGTTVATNSLIERDGAHTAFLTTRGFRDTLEIRRTNRQELYDAQWRPPPPLIARRHRLEVTERMRWDGSVDTPIDEDQLEDVIETLTARNFDAVAICLLHAYENPEHERHIRRRVQEALPGAFVTCSSDLSLEFREFERGCTVAANAYVGPKVRRYMGNMTQRLADAGYDGEVSIMQSNGGVCSIDEARESPVKLARSGPAGGAMAIDLLADLTGNLNLVGIDIGGTSADVALIVDGEPRWTSPLIVEWGLPLLFPSVEVVSIGAGGGSLAWIDEVGVLHMGPHSAGADPGPACYARGGTRPTSTDAHVALGRVAVDGLIDGDLAIDPELSREAIRRYVAEPLGLEIEHAAEGMLRILDTAMLQAVRLLTIEKGYDPRDFALVGLGGGGPMHCAALAHELGMRHAIVPNMPGVLSAWGMLTVDMVQDRSRTVLKRRHAVEPEALGRTFAELRDDVHGAFARQHLTAEAVRLEYVLDMQYFGQVHTLPVSLGELETDGQGRPHVDAALLDRANALFHQEHQREYGHADTRQEVQIVHARLFGRASVSSPEVPMVDSADGPVQDAQVSRRNVYFAGAYVNTAVYDRSLLRSGHHLQGPAVITEASSTTIVPPGCAVGVDDHGTLTIDVAGATPAERKRWRPPTSR